MATIGWLDTDTFPDYLKAHLAKAGSETLQSHWTLIANAAVRTAYWSIVSPFVARGYSQAQVDQWDRGEEFQQDIAVHIALKRLAAMQPSEYGAAALDAIDRRPELLGDRSKGIEPVPLTIGGAFADPAGSHGQITTGPMDTSTDQFGTFDPHDSRLGEVTRL